MLLLKCFIIVLTFINLTMSQQYWECYCYVESINNIDDLQSQNVCNNMIQKNINRTKNIYFNTTDNKCYNLQSNDGYIGFCNNLQGNCMELQANLMPSCDTIYGSTNCLND